MPSEVIDRVNQLGKHDDQPELLTFYNRKGDLIGDTKLSDATQGVETVIDALANHATEPIEAETTNEEILLEQNTETIESEPTHGDLETAAPPENHEIKGATKTANEEPSPTSTEGVVDDIPAPRRSARN